MRLRNQTYALTTVAYLRRHVFQRDAIAELLIAILFRNRDAGKFQLHAFVVMPNHAHILLTPSTNLTIERCAQLIKGGFSYAAREQCTGEIWQKSYYAHRVTDQDDLIAQTRYILNNPVKRHLEAYPHIHTSALYASRLDPPPPLERSPNA